MIGLLLVTVGHTSMETDVIHIGGVASRTATLVPVPYP